MKLTAVGAGARDLATGTFVAAADGRASHVGFTGLRADGTFVLGPIVALSGTTTVTAANGDELSGTFEGTSTHLIPAGQSDASFVVTFTGGTGRFEDASGTLDVESHSVLTSIDGTTLHSQDTYVGTGRISY